MKTRNILSVLAALAIVAAAASLASCPASIYYTLENEVETPDSTLNNLISILGMTKSGSDYYAAAGPVWRGVAGTGTVTWDTAAPLTPPVAGAMCNSLVTFGVTGDLYGGFITQSGNLGLYKAAGLSPSDFSVQVPHLLVKDKQVILLDVLKSGGDLVVCTGTPVSGPDPFQYDLVISTDGVAFASLLLPAVITRPFTGVAFTSTPDTYWAVSGTSLYSGTAGSLAVDTRLVKSSSDEVLTSVFGDNGTRLFVASNKGFVYYSDDEGTTWYKNAAAVEVNGTGVSFLTVAGGSSSSSMLVGSNGYGYFILTIAGSAPSLTLTLTRFSVNTIGLYSGSVRQFLLDPVYPNRLFACTNAKGLWRNESFDSATCAVGAWSQE